MSDNLSEEQISYIKERGFKIIEGNPPKREPTPYVTLKKIQEKNPSFSDSEVKYHYDHSSFIGSPTSVHPSITEKNKLIKIIEEMVFHNTKIIEKSYKVSSEPIKIFVIDPDWNGIVKELTDKYK